MPNDNTITLVPFEIVSPFKYLALIGYLSIVIRLVFSWLRAEEGHKDYFNFSSYKKDESKQPPVELKKKKFAEELYLHQPVWRKSF